MPTITVDEAYAHCTAMARSHYENFPVGLLAPERIRHHVHAVYAFARYADDLADEGYGATSQASRENLAGKGAVTVVERQPLGEADRLAALDDWERQLLASVLGGRAEIHPILVALQATIRELDLPAALFTDLISAFKQDVRKRRYANFPEVLDYCRRSANPIGRLVLLLHGYRDRRLHALSDAICTALQLANFWQDVAVDLDKDRLYLPEDELARFGVTIEDLQARRITQAYRQLLRFQVARTQELFDAGEPLSSDLDAKLGWEIRLTWLGGTTILRKIEDQNFDTLTRRPKLSKRDFLALLGQSWVSR